MTTFHNNKLNMISLDDNDNHVYSPADMGVNMASMSSPLMSQPELNHLPTGYGVPGSNGNGNHGPSYIAQSPGFLFNDNHVDDGGWNTDPWSHNNAYPDTEFGQSFDMNASQVFADTHDSAYSQAHHRAPTYDNLTSPTMEGMENDDATPADDHMNGTVTTHALHNESQGSQPGNDFVGQATNIKLEESINCDQPESLTPAYSEYDKYEESNIGGSRTRNVAKTNKDGGVRKPRQPRAKLLKWSDNDWKNVALGIVWACGETGVQIPFDQAAQIVGVNCTAGALQQAILKLRQKQVAEGHFIPSLKMAWGRNPKISGSVVSTADDAKFPQDTTKTKTMLPKKKPTRFFGDQTHLITLKRAYKEFERAHLAFPHVFLSQIVAPVQEHGTTAPFEDEVIDHFGDSGLGYAGPDTPCSPMQKRRSNYRVSYEGSPVPAQELYIDMSQVQAPNRKSQIQDGALYQNFAFAGPDGEGFTGTMSTPALTVDSGFCTQLGTPTSNLSPRRGHGMASTGPVNWIDFSQTTPPNTVIANKTIARGFYSIPHNPQGTQQYEFPSSDGMVYHHQAARYNMAPSNAAMQAPSFGNTSFLDANANLGFATTTFDDPFWNN